jgi:hypothetical protein
VDGTGSKSCPMAGFGISGVETLGYAGREFVKFLISCDTVVGYKCAQ